MDNLQISNKINGTTVDKDGRGRDERKGQNFIELGEGKWSD